MYALNVVTSSILNGISVFFRLMKATAEYSDARIADTKDFFQSLMTEFGFNINRVTVSEGRENLA